MKNMKCVDCALKHLAAAIAFYKELKTFEPESNNHTDRVMQHIALAISYAKEVLSGHDKSNTLDHRADMLGELIIVESLIYNASLKKGTSSIRKRIQSNSLIPSMIDIVHLQRIYDMLKYKKLEFPAVGEADFGEIMNAEHHLYLLSPGIAFAVGKLRAMFQRDDEPTNIAEVLRNHWQNLDKQFFPAPDNTKTMKVKKSGCRSCGKKKG